MSSIDDINKQILELKIKGENVKNISDGHHTFLELYELKMVLFSALCNAYPELCWKSKKHFDEANDPMFNGCFIVGINTPKGVTTYHFKLKYWDEFNVPIIANAPKYDGYSYNESLEKIKSLKNKLNFNG